MQIPNGAQMVWSATILANASAVGRPGIVILELIKRYLQLSASLSFPRYAKLPLRDHRGKHDAAVEAHTRCPHIVVRLILGVTSYELCQTITGTEQELLVSSYVPPIENKIIPL